MCWRCCRQDKAHLLVTTEMDERADGAPLDAAGRAVMIDVPIEARYAPNVYLERLLCQRRRDVHDRPLLTVPARDKFLSLEIIPNKNEYKPRETASYTVLARNADGSPAAGAEVSLGVVDEAIYSIRPEQTGDIRKAFYGRRYNQVQTNFVDLLLFLRLRPATKPSIWRRIAGPFSSPTSRTKANMPSRRFARSSRTRPSGSPTW